MWRDVEPRSIERDRPEPGRGRVGGSADVESISRSGDPRDVFTRDLELPRGSSRERVRANGRDTQCRARTFVYSQPSAPFGWCRQATFASRAHGLRHAPRVTLNAFEILVW